MDFKLSINTDAIIKHSINVSIKMLTPCRKRLTAFIILNLILVNSISLTRQSLISNGNNTCNDTCLIESNGTYSRSNCFCDDCHLFDDCCSNNQKEIFEKNFECNLKLNNNNEYTYSISKCDNSWSNLHIRNKCESEVDEEDVFKYLPVYSKQTNRTYKNMYCANCNIKQLNVSLIKFFKLVPKMPKHMLSNLNNQSDNEALNVVEQAIKNFIQNKRIDDENAELEFEFKEPEKTLVKRRCLKAVNRCPEASTREQKEKCESYTAYRRKIGEKVIYKNIDCAICNGVKVEELACNIHQINFKPKRKQLKSLQLLFDLSELYGEIRINLNLKYDEKEVNFRNDNYNCKQTENSTTFMVNMMCNSFTQNKTNMNSSKKSECDLKDNNIGDYVKKYMTICGQLISIISLILLLIMYFSNKVLRNLPGKLLICLSVSLLLSQILFLVSTYITKPYTHYALNSSSYDCNSKLNNNFENISVLLDSIFKSKSLDCYILGLLTHYFYLAFFTWSNIMAYDLYKMFLVISSSKTSTIKHNDDRRHFMVYSIVGWVFPIIVIIGLIIKQFIYKMMAYSFKGCFISSQIDLLIFFVAPIFIILLANSYFLIFSIISIRKVDKLSRKYLRSDNSSTKNNDTSSSLIEKEALSNQNVKKTIKQVDENTGNKKRLILFLKLFILTGMTWILGIASLFNRNSFLWYIYIVLNSFQGLFIFCAYAFNIQTKKQITETKIYKTISSLLSSSSNQANRSESDYGNKSRNSSTSYNSRK